MYRNTGVMPACCRQEIPEDFNPDKSQMDSFRFTHPQVLIQTERESVKLLRFSRSPILRFSILWNMNRGNGDAGKYGFDKIFESKLKFKR